jgi:hypothetical protein
VISDAARDAHDRAVRDGEAMYPDPVTGFLVMTTATLLERGECCGSGCRHCPYPPDEQRAAGRPDVPPATGEGSPVEG